MPKFLIDESLSPKLANFLTELGYDACAVRDVGLKGKTDEEIVAWVKKNRRVIITCDHDFGMIYFLREKGAIGVILLKSQLQGILSFIRILKYLIKEGFLEDKSLLFSFVVSTENKIRRYPENNFEEKKDN